VNGAAPRMCYLPAAAASASAEVTYEPVPPSRIAANGRCKCAGDIVRVGLAPHPAHVAVQVLQQNGEKVTSCKVNLNSLDGTCDEDAAVIAASVQV
jgi:hypothetical protein